MLLFQLFLYMLIRFFFDIEQQHPPIPAPLAHSAPQPILLRRSISPGGLVQSHDSPVVVSPRHTVAMPSPSSWMNNPSPAASTLVSSARDSDSPHSYPDTDTQSSTSTTPTPAPFISQANTPLSISLPSSPRNNGSNLALSPSQRALSASGGLLPPPPRSTSSSPNRRSSRMSVAMVTSHSTPPNHQFSPRASLSLQVSTSYPHTPASHSPNRVPVSPRAISVSANAAMDRNSMTSPYGPDWNVHARPYPNHSTSDRQMMGRQFADYPELRPRASSYAPEPTFIFSSDGEELDEKANRRRSFQVLDEDSFFFFCEYLINKWL